MSNIPFQQVPSNLRVPIFTAEVNNQLANSGGQAQSALIIGQITATGLATPNVPLLSQGANDAIVQGGVDSNLALMTAAYLANDPSGEVWYLPLSDAAGATAATGTIAFAGTVTANSTLSLYVGGTLVATALTAGEAAAAVATAVAAAINATPNLPVSATAATSTVTLTAVNKGLTGNDVDLRLNYQGAAKGEVTPAGLTPTITAMSGGATNPTLTTALANLSSQAFDFICCPYTDTASLTALEAFLSDSVGRWSWETQLFGGVFTAYRGTMSGQTTFGITNNNQHVSVMGLYDSPTPAWIWAAAYTGACAASLKVDPSQPLNTVPIYGVLAPPIPSRFTTQEQNTLLFDGISTFTVDSGGLVHIQKAITTYQLNAQGQPDNSYLRVETLFNLMFVLRSLIGDVSSKFGRAKLGADGGTYGAGSGVVTPSTVKAEVVANYLELEANGNVQNGQAFAQNVIVQQNATNPNRLDCLWPGTLIDGLDIFGLLAQFRLQ